MQTINPRLTTRLPAFALFFSLLILGLVACTSPAPAVVASVTINETDQALQVGESADLTVTVVAEGGASEAVSWKSSSEAVASVSAAGKLDALAAGTAIITATSVFDSNKSDSITVRVTVDPLPTPAVTSVTIDQGEQALQVGDSADLTVTIVAEGGASEAVSWKSSNEVVASVTATGKLDALAAGTAIITATSVFDSTKSDTITVTVTADPVVTPTPVVTSVTINEGDQELALDAIFSFTASVTAEHGANDTVTWTSINEGVATINSSGTLQMLAAGTTSITATSTFDASRKDSVAVNVYDPAVPMWTHQFGTDKADRVLSATTDADGNVIAVGETLGVLAGAANYGSFDAFIQKFTPEGIVLWTEQLGTDKWDKATGVTTDAHNNIIVVIQTNGALIPGEASIGGTDIYVLKLNSNGNYMWLKQFGGPGGDSTTGVTTDSANNIIITGHTSGNFDRPVQGSHDAFVLKLNPAGQEAWRKQFGGNQQDMAHAVATDSEDNIIIAGFTAGVLPGTLEGVNHGSTDAFVQKLDASGNHIWASQFGTTQFDSATGVTIDSEDSIIIVGETEGEFPGGSAAGGDDAFAHKLASDGTQIWTRQFGSDKDDDAQGVTIDSQDSITVAGKTYGDFGGSLNGDFDGYTHKLDASGNTIRTIQFGVADRVNVHGVTSDLHDNIIIFGETDGDLGGVNLGSFDAFVRKQKP